MGDEPSTSSAITLAESTRLNNILAASALTMLWYDFTLTLPREIESFWKDARVSLVSILFVINRYLGLLGPVPVIFEYFIALPQSRCRKLQRYHQYYAVISQVIVGTLLVIRTWALYNRSRKMLIGLVVSSMILVIVTLVVGNLKDAESDDDTPSYDTCDLSLSEDQGFRSAIGWVAMLFLDTTVFALTLFRTLQMRHMMYQPTLLMVLFRDGAIYYAILAVVNAANIMTFVFPHGGYYKRGLVTTLANALSTTLVSRIFLNLRDPSLTGGARRGGRWTLTGSHVAESVSTRMMSFCRHTFKPSDPELPPDDEEFTTEADRPWVAPPPSAPPPLSLSPSPPLSPPQPRETRP